MKTKEFFNQEELPLGAREDTNIYDALKDFRVIIHQKDGTKWSRLCGDVIFKKVFCTNPDILKYYLDEILHDDVTIKQVSIPEIPNMNMNTSNQRIDLLVRLEDGRLANIEMNTSRRKGLYNRLLGTIAHEITSNITDSQGYYKQMKESIQINFTYGMSDDEPEEDIFYMSSPESGRIFSDRAKIIEFNCSKITKKWYTNGKKKGGKYDFIIPFALNKKEFEKFAKGDEIMEKLFKETNKVNEDPTFQSYMTYEEDQTRIQNDMLEEAKEDGLAEGEASGRAENSKEIAQKMLDEKYDIDTISRLTGLSKDEIRLLKKKSK